MKAALTEKISSLLAEFRRQRNLPELWRAPLLKFVDARHPGLADLPALVYPTHHQPADFLPDPAIILAYFLPFGIEAVQSNIGGRYASEPWVQVYLQSQQAIKFINAGLQARLEQLGLQAASPEGAGYVARGVYKSRWSHRHIARLGGMGTFGLNNLLITDSGCCGYYSTLITNLPEPADPALGEERCLHKRDGTCGLCLKRCVGAALTAEGFDRHKCYDMCMENAAHYSGRDFISIADACGKCAAGLPCALGNPAARIRG